VNRRLRGITLVELLISIVLLSIIVLGLGSIDLFSRSHVISSDRRVRISNDASLALEHMGKQIMNAFGNEIIDGANSVVSVVANSPPSDDGNTIRFKIDSDNNGTADTWRAYLYHNKLATSGKNQIWYCPQCLDSTCVTCTTHTWGDTNYPDDIIAKNISGFTPCKPLVDGTCCPSPYTGCVLGKNYVTITIQACWDPAESHYSCGTPNNPSVNMKADITMPSVTTN